MPAEDPLLFWLAAVDNDMPEEIAEEFEQRGWIVTAHPEGYEGYTFTEKGQRALEAAGKAARDAE